MSRLTPPSHLLVIRACIDMQYPPRRKLDPETGFAQYLSEDGEDLNGGIPLEAPDGPLPPGYDLVHFDLDPQNSELSLGP